MDRSTLSTCTCEELQQFYKLFDHLDEKRAGQLVVSDVRNKLARVLPFCPIRSMRSTEGDSTIDFGGFVHLMDDFKKATTKTPIDMQNLLRFARTKLMPNGIRGTPAQKPPNFLANSKQIGLSYDYIQTLWVLFHSEDKDRSGTLEKAEVEAALSNAAGKAWGLCDGDSDGRYDFGEYMNSVKYGMLEGGGDGVEILISRIVSNIECGATPANGQPVPPEAPAAVPAPVKQPAPLAPSAKCGATIEELSQLHKLFLSLDTDKSGTLNTNEVHAKFHDYFPDVTLQEENNDGQTDFAEFVHTMVLGGTSLLYRALERARLRLHPDGASRQDSLHEPEPSAIPGEIQSHSCDFTYNEIRQIRKLFNFLDSSSAGQIQFSEVQANLPRLSELGIPPLSFATYNRPSSIPKMDFGEFVYMLETCLTNPARKQVIDAAEHLNEGGRKQ